MKTLALLTAGLLGSSALFAQEPTAADSTGLPGDNFSLQGALDLFKRAKDLEDFEKALNNADNKVNNLDLNGDGEVDYIRVVDNVDPSNTNVHAIVLQVPVNKEESQDVAVIGLERKGPQEAVAQIKGDETLYGADMIVEPAGEKEQNMKGASGPSVPEMAPMFVVVNVWGWPCVQWFWGPTYVVWSSPWYWGYYPPYWHPWRPYGWRTWWGWNYHYRPYYACVRVDRVGAANRIYAPRRMGSPTVVERRGTVVQHRTGPAARPAQGGHAGEQRGRQMQPANGHRSGTMRGGDRMPSRNGGVRAPRGGGNMGGGVNGGGNRGGGGGRRR
ncbi:MAG: hypothetical protein QM724_02675 [Flavobacteriales bacterium]